MQLQEPAEPLAGVPCFFLSRTLIFEKIAPKPCQDLFFTMAAFFELDSYVLTNKCLIKPCIDLSDKVSIAKPGTLSLFIEK